MFGLFKKKPLPLENYSVLGTDMHSHLLPGIDDGAPDLETSLGLIGQLQALGFRQIYTTPHIREGLYPNTPELVLKKRDEVQTALQQAGLTVNFDVAAEYFLDESFDAALRGSALLCLPGRRVLIEMSPRQPYPDLHRVLFDLQMSGYHPVLAHPERYTYYKRTEDYEQLKTLGCSLQVNMLSLTGYYGKPVQAAAQMIIQGKLADFLATDLHHERHVEKLQQALKHPVMMAVLSENTFLNTELERSECV
ncbi:MAG: CpsB/CapC family capsule biosynthesis tyrosine phosphatase [Saprospiraceae bacterium]|nr:CpsB/CapC family capsule biosynthesis tyrosine phosphatase [Saprospiraceae bacterium]